MDTRLCYSIFAALALSLAACSSEDTPPAGGGGSGGTGGGGAGAAGSPGACDASKLPGLWGGANYSMEILADMTYRASGTPNMASIDVTGTLQVDACNVSIVDASGQYACPASQVGSYTFAVTDTTLAFTLVSDACDGRRIPLTAGPLTKK